MSQVIQWRKLLTLSILLVLLISIVATVRLAEAEPVSFPGRWIDVDLSSLTITAFDGTNAVYSAPITAGKPGYETPSGTYYVSCRVLSEIMDSETLGVPRTAAEGYYLPNVLYTQYLSAGGGLAIHSNYWASDSAFGNFNTSHGCVSMRTADAEFFWNFSGAGTPVHLHRVPNMPEATPTAQEATPTPPPSPTATPTPSPTPTPIPVRPPVNGTAWVPNVVGMTVAEAQSRIDTAGLRTTYVNYQSETDVPDSLRAFYDNVQPGCVLSTNPNVDTPLPVGSVVNIAARTLR